MRKGVMSMVLKGRRPRVPEGRVLRYCARTPGRPTRRSGRTSVMARPTFSASLSPTMPRVGFVFARKKVAEYVAAHPEETYEEIGKRLGYSGSQVSRISRASGIVRRRGRRRRVSRFATE